MPERLEVLVDGGKATAGPPLGPALGPMGLNIGQVLKDINEKTKAFEGMKVPVVLLVDTKAKTYTIEVGTPPVSALVLKEVKAEKGSGTPNKASVGNLTVKAAIRVANIKKDALGGKTLRDRVSEVVGTCVSMGVTFEGMPAKDATKAIASGKWDKELSG
jgi:large subunit ribosomal protein L11